MTLTKQIIVLLTLCLSACSSYNASVDKQVGYDFSQVDSYHIVADSHDKNRMLSDIDRNRINAAIDTQSQAQGLEKVSLEKADIMIAYFLVTKDKIDVDTTYSGHYGRYYGPGYAGVSTVHTHDYVEGTLVIDFIDSKTKQSVMRSTLSKKLKQLDSAQEREEEINKVIATMFEKIKFSESQQA
ncbi:DUF4136 domain-containing protein [Thalassotalea agarivorans]|uniref:DUF4136 domain-containing protein n=1 Tax=Thalassotalea agarivorans TaxID=349064 RepID=A0A1I0AEK1_THASX|nr:DUF4136 domain-containing protein [Thalassotalea agarivorans]SES92113.1 protein of unknown function [Thalassotalea agarivorans]